MGQQEQKKQLGIVRDCSKLLVIPNARRNLTVTRQRLALPREIPLWAFAIRALSDFGFSWGPLIPAADTLHQFVGNTHSVHIILL